LLHRKSIAGAQVDRAERPLSQFLQGSNMCLCQVDYMNVIANAGAICRGVIRAKDGKHWTLALQHLERYGDNVGFWIVIFTVGLGCARHIEVAEGSPVDTVLSLKVGEELLHHELGVSVWIDRVLGIGLLDWQCF